VERPISSVPEAVFALVERFERQQQAYRSGQYNETQLRREFLDPFWEALGWDVNNRRGYAEAYKDVIHEDAIKIGGVTKAPDYCFRIGGTRKFFVEAKKPSVNIRDDLVPAFQLRRYAWSARLPLSVLTDFEEFAVYDCRVKPVKTDKASIGRILYLTCSDFLSRWHEIASVFSRDAVLKGSFDAFADSNKDKKGTTEVDVAFLKEMESWRELLARHLALRNPQITQRELNYAVQMILDRILFLRIGEDRGIEPYGRLAALQSGARVYRRLFEIFRQADDRYNSGLFHFRREKDRADPADDLTPDLEIDDKPIKEILSALYYPESPYEFSVLPADLLGQVYERFLGKVIRLTAGHRAVLEEKPEVKKAGGVFYTPTTIVDYIVKNTVGKLLEERSWKPGKSLKDLRIIDPACGSGSFLLGAYQYLLDWYGNRYTDHQPEKWARGRTPALYQTHKGEWRLTASERKRILLHHIYGVDIDSQAVEVTKLSLLLKVLEGESDETLSRQLTMFRERALPDLAANIRCGNSLIGPDFYQDHQQMSLFNEEERYRINVFDWDAEFPQIMQGGGFDAVIGNPPYVRQEMLADFKDYLSKAYRTYHGVADLYVYFIERGMKLLKQGGSFGYIVANKWMRANYGERLRRWLKERRIEEIVDFGDLPVFETATTYPCILLMRNDSPAATFQATQVKSLDFRSLDGYVAEHRYPVVQAGLEAEGWSLSDSRTQALLTRLRSMGVPLGEYVQGKIYYGIKTGLNEAFVIDAATRARLIAEDPGNAELIKPFLAGRDIKRYQPPTGKRYLIFARRGVDIKKYPAIMQHLHGFKEQLMPKPKDWKQAVWKGRKPGPYEWYEIQDTVAYHEEFEKPKILLPDISTRGNCALDETGGFYSANTTYLLCSADKYLLGLLNSSLMDFYYRNLTAVYRGGYLRFFAQYLVQLPIRPIDSTNPADAVRHDRMVQLVEEMLSLQKQSAVARTGHEKTMLQRQIDAVDRRIDLLVYELYALTEDEITIVEKGAT
jgi:hypothetical protein